MTVESYRQAALAIVAEEDELGTGGEPSVRGPFSYVEYWTADERKV